MLREQLDFHTQTSLGSQPEPNEPVYAGPSTSFNAQVGGIQNQVLPQAVATALARADVLDVKIKTRYHTLQSQQKLDDLSTMKR